MENPPLAPQAPEPWAERGQSRLQAGSLLVSFSPAEVAPHKATLTGPGDTRQEKGDHSKNRPRLQVEAWSTPAVSVAWNTVPETLEKAVVKLLLVHSLAVSWICWPWHPI